MNDIVVWKSYPEFPWVEVSPFGDVRTRNRVVPCGKGARVVKGHNLKPYCKKNGYLEAVFGVNGRVVHRSIHRLVAQTFIPNPDNLPQVNHKDCNPKNNNVGNLEWCTHEYNIEYREKYGKSAEEALGRPVYAVNLKTLEVSLFPSQMEVGRVLGVYPENVSAVIKGKLKQTGGYWFTEDDSEINRDKLREIEASIPFRGIVIAVNLKTLEVLRFQSQSEAYRQLGACRQNINAVIKGRLKQTKGYWFTNYDSNAVESTRDKLGDKVAEKVEELMKR